MTKLEKAKKDLSDFLSKKPNLIPFQKEIDYLMSKCVTSEQRMLVLKELLEEKNQLLTEAVGGLISNVDKITKDKLCLKK